jgi:hypothetical protein
MLNDYCKQCKTENLFNMMHFCGLLSSEAMLSLFQMTVKLEKESRAQDQVLKLLRLRESPCLEAQNLQNVAMDTLKFTDHLVLVDSVR